jgi:hypothetical protein
VEGDPYLPPAQLLMKSPFRFKLLSNSAFLTDIYSSPLRAQGDAANRGP